MAQLHFSHLQQVVQAGFPAGASAAVTSEGPSRNIEVASSVMRVRIARYLSSWDQPGEQCVFSSRFIPARPQSGRGSACC
ncbi:MAG: hypothetical protein HC898_12670 [Phycisphaerales bacterium]|nr:hypothetical protein [Phycisphaerales bacterium]